MSSWQEQAKLELMKDFKSFIVEKYKYYTKALGSISSHMKENRVDDRPEDLFHCLQMCESLVDAIRDDMEQWVDIVETAMQLEDEGYEVTIEEEEDELH